MSVWSSSATRCWRRVSAQLFARFPDAREGELTRLRSSLVNEATLAVIARKLHLDDCLRLARGEENQGGRQRDSLLSDAMEAVSAAYSWTGGLRRRARSWSGCTQISGPRTPRRYGARISRRSCRRPRSASARGFPCMRLRTAMVPSTPRFFRPRGSARRAPVPRLRPRTQAGRTGSRPCRAGRAGRGGWRGKVEEKNKGGEKGTFLKVPFSPPPIFTPPASPPVT